MIFTVEAAFAAWLGGAAIAALPPYTLTAIDDFGSRPAPVAEGVMAGQYGCIAYTPRCGGAYELDYKLPFAISAFYGQLDLFQAYGFEPPILDVPLVFPSHAYHSFYAQTFNVPTDTIRLVWQAGLQSTDDYGEFTLSHAYVALPVSEPGRSLWLLPLVVWALLAKRGLR